MAHRRSRQRGRRGRWHREPEPESAQVGPTLDPREELPGSLYQVPDKVWGFEAVGRVEHPGACVVLNEAQRNAVFLKGGSSPSRHCACMSVEPTAHSGLKKRTWFELAPRVLPLRRAVLLHHDRRLGALTRDEHIFALKELHRLFPVPEAEGEET